MSEVSSIKTGETESFKFIFRLLSSTSDTISIKYLELKLILRLSELKFALIISFPSPELTLLTESWMFSFLMVNFTPSFLSKETLATLSMEFIKSFEGTIKHFELLHSNSWRFKTTYIKISW